MFIVNVSPLVYETMNVLIQKKNSGDNDKIWHPKIILVSYTYGHSNHKLLKAKTDLKGQRIHKFY